MALGITKRHRLILNRFAFGLLVVIALNCSKSPIGPQLSDKDYTGSGTGIGGATGTTSGTSSTTAVACSRTIGHNVYYGKSTVRLVYTCDSALTLVSPTDMPSFLTSSLSGLTVTFTGTAPDLASSTTWSFSVNGATTTGSNTAITTAVLATTGLLPSMSTALDMSAGYNVELDPNLELALSSSWDGSMTDVSYIGASISTDMHGITLSSSCSTSTAPYLCNGTQTNSATTTKNADFNIKWKWSAFDQGSYTLNVVPSAVIESGTTSLATQSQTFTIPIQQSTGNQTLTKTGTVSGFDSMIYTPAIAVNTSSSGVLAPYVGLTYQTSSGTNTNYFTRLAVDRTDDPSGGVNGITQVASQLDLTNGSNSRFMRMRSLSSTSWAAISAKANAISGFDIRFSLVTDDAVNATTATMSSASISLAAFQSNQMTAMWLDMTEPFVDSDGTTRFGYAFVRSPDAGTTKHTLVIAKANPAGTDEASANDDSNFDSKINAGDDGACEIDIGGASTDTADRLRIQYAVESSTRYFYLAYRKLTALYVVKIPAAKNATTPCSGLAPVNLTGDLSTAAFEDLGESDAQNIGMTLGSKSGSTIVGTVWRQPDATASGIPGCFFRRVDQSLSTKGDALQISTRKCYNPSIQFSAATGRFLITYAEKQSATNNYDLKFVEITLGSGTTDTASTPLIVSDFTTVSALGYPVKLETSFYPAGNWMAVFYRLNGTNVLKFHGFHVPGF